MRDQSFGAALFEGKCGYQVRVWVIGICARIGAVADALQSSRYVVRERICELRRRANAKLQAVALKPGVEGFAGELAQVVVGQGCDVGPMIHLGDAPAAVESVCDTGGGAIAVVGNGDFTRGIRHVRACDVPRPSPGLEPAAVGIGIFDERLIGVRLGSAEGKKRNASSRPVLRERPCALGGYRTF